MPDELLLTPPEAARFLKISLRKFYKLRKSSNPPPALMVGEQPRFLQSDLLAWTRSLSSR